jgi:hypothetical protein
MGTKGAVLLQDDGSIIANTKANKSTPIDEDKYCDVMS